jgi:hypothetical protein
MIQNEGTRTLLGVSSRIGGGDRRDFRIKGPAAESVGPASSTIFSATFRPRAKGKRAATVIVTSMNGGAQKVVLTGKGR